jgi:flagellar protein FlbD
MREIERRVMIHLTKLNNQPMVLNSELVEFIENKPDTVITLITGNKVVVLETTEEVINRIVDFRRRVMAGICTALPPKTTWQPDDDSSGSD